MHESKTPLDADSLDVFEIMNELEDKFEIELDADEGIETISDVVDFVKKNNWMKNNALRNII